MTTRCHNSFIRLLGLALVMACVFALTGCTTNKREQVAQEKYFEAEWAWNVYNIDGTNSAESQRLADAMEKANQVWWEARK